MTQLCLPMSYQRSSVELGGRKQECNWINRVEIRLRHQPSNPMYYFSDIGVYTTSLQRPQPRPVRGRLLRDAYLNYSLALRCLTSNSIH
jgi:hypothetical protein